MPVPKVTSYKEFEGEREDGRFQKMSVFADDIFQAQALAFDKNGALYCVCTREVLILHDKDGDGRSEARTRILHLDPYEKRAYPHGQMQGIAFSNDGCMGGPAARAMIGSAVMGNVLASAPIT